MGDKEVGPAVIVIVGPDGAEAVVALVVMDASFEADFLEGAVAAIVVQEVGFAGESPGAALHLDPFVRAELVAAELREMI